MGKCKESGIIIEFGLGAFLMSEVAQQKWCGENNNSQDIMQHAKFAGQEMMVNETSPTKLLTQL